MPDTLYDIWKCSKAGTPYAGTPNSALVRPSTAPIFCTPKPDLTALEKEIPTGIEELEDMLK